MHLPFNLAMSTWEINPEDTLPIIQKYMCKSLVTTHYLELQNIRNNINVHMSESGWKYSHSKCYSAIRKDDLYQLKQSFQPLLPKKGKE